jgi:hypothetical protein
MTTANRFHPPGGSDEQATLGSYTVTAKVAELTTPSVFALTVP